jgi:hypothetical protein
MAKQRQMRLVPVTRRSHDVDSGHCVTEAKVQEPGCIHCGRRHRSADAEARCAAKAAAKVAREARPVCPVCGRRHRTEAAKQRCEAKVNKTERTVCPVCGKRHRKADVAARCLEHAEAVKRADRIFEIAAQL